MLRHHSAFFIAEHMLSLYILSIGVLTLGGLLAFGQHQLRQKESQLQRYMIAEQLALEVTPAQATSESLKLNRRPGAIQITWPDRRQIQCYVQS